MSRDGPARCVILVTVFDFSRPMSGDVSPPQPRQMCSRAFPWLVLAVAGWRAVRPEMRRRTRRGSSAGRLGCWPRSTGGSRRRRRTTAGARLSTCNDRRSRRTSGAPMRNRSRGFLLPVSWGSGRSSAWSANIIRNWRRGCGRAAVQREGSKSQPGRALVLGGDGHAAVARRARGDRRVQGAPARPHGAQTPSGRTCARGGAVPVRFRVGAGGAIVGETCVAKPRA